ncbi:MAG: DUF1987 domain-containing protein [Bacteroidales bacterium]|nr:DUF1987 domain-containing protein [Bacteroidales bacterium]MBN2821043.1 DUF1987 domain-containing protein [Bacteroidales bacterium]
MDRLFIEASDDTPEVNFNKEENIFEISGKILPENEAEFFEPIYQWFDNYIKDPNSSTTLKLKIDYFNSASHKAINELLEILCKINSENVKVEWHYIKDDDDMLESGNDYAELTGLNFVYKPYS